MGKRTRQVMVKLFSLRLSALPAVVAVLLFADATPTHAEAGFIGLQVQGINAETATALGLPDLKGVLVLDVALGGPSARAGFRRGDMIVELDGQVIDTFERLIRSVRGIAAGRTVLVKVLRAGKSLTLTLETDAWPSAWLVKKDAVATLPEIGLTMAAVTPKIRERFGVRWGSTGILVTLVDETKLDAGELQRGDLILQVNQRDVWTPDQFVSRYKGAKGRGQQKILLLIERSQGFRFVLLPLQ